MSQYFITGGPEPLIYYINDFNSAPAPPITKQDSLLRLNTPSPFNPSKFRSPICFSSPAPPDCDLAKQENLLSSTPLSPSLCNPIGQEDLLYFNTLPPSDSEQSKQEDLLHSTSYRPYEVILEYYILLILDLLLSSQACSTYSLKRDPQHCPKLAIHHIFSEDIYSKFTLAQGYTLVQLY